MGNGTTYRIFRGEQYIGMDHRDYTVARRYWEKRSYETGYEYTMKKWN